MSDNNNTPNRIGALQRPNSLNEGLSSISDENHSMILTARKTLDDLRTSLSEGNHMTDDKPTSMLIKDAEEALATALREGQLILSDEGLTTIVEATKRGFGMLGLRADYDFHLTNAHRAKVEEAEKFYNERLATDEGQAQANDIMAIHIANGRCGSMKHSLSVRDGRTNLSTTSRYVSPIGANSKLLDRVCDIDSDIVEVESK